MYAYKTYSYSPSVKLASYQVAPTDTGLSHDGTYAWVAREGSLLVWNVAEGSYAAVKSLPCQGVPLPSAITLTCLFLM
jgi:hypothetical protein